jgi:hypothetical protein
MAGWASCGRSLRPAEFSGRDAEQAAQLRFRLRQFGQARRIQHGEKGLARRVECVLEAASGRMAQSAPAKHGTSAMSGSIRRTTSPAVISAAGRASSSPPPRPRSVVTSPA